MRTSKIKIVSKLSGMTNESVFNLSAEFCQAEKGSAAGLCFNTKKNGMRFAHPLF